MQIEYSILGSHRYYANVPWLAYSSHRAKEYPHAKKFTCVITTFCLNSKMEIGDFKMDAMVGSQSYYRTHIWVDFARIRAH